MKLLKRHILAAASTGVLLCLGAANSHAYEAPSLSFHPVASWDVSDMTHPQTGDKHCLLVNEYNNGFILQFQGSKGKIESLSIDLRQNAFTAGQSKKVSATLPGKTSAMLDAKAFNPNTLAVNLLNQSAFFNDLKSASALDLKIDENAFRFFMTGFANAAKSFERCMNPAAAAAPVAEAAPVQDEMPVSAGEPVREAPSQLMQERSAAAQEQYAEELSVILQEPKEKVSAELQKAMRDQQALMDDNALNEKPEPMQKERYTDQLAEKMGTVKESEMKQAAAPVAAPAPAPSAEDGITLPNDAEKSGNNEIAWNAPSVSEQIEIVEPPAQTAAVASEAPKSDDNEKSLIEDVQDWFEGDAPKAKTAEAATDIIAPPAVEEPEAASQEEMLPIATPPKVHNYTTPEPKVTKEVTTMEADFTGSGLPVREVGKPEAKEPFSERYAAAKGVDRLENEVERLSRENQALNSELEAALRAGEKERLEISSDNWNLEEATMRYNEAERQLAKMGQQIQKERAQCTYEKKELEMMLFDPQVTEEAQLARLATLEKKIQELQAELDLARKSQ